MRRIKIMEHITLYGVIQAPGGSDEDGDQRRPIEHRETWGTRHPALRLMER